MVFVTYVLTLCLLPHVRSVKLVIDGTIDFGPNWNFGSEHNPIISLIPRTASHYDTNLLQKSDNADTSLERETERVSTGILENPNRHAMTEESETSSNIDEEKYSQVTTLYKTSNKKKPMFKTPHSVKDEKDVVTFLYHIKNKTLTMYDDIRQMFNDTMLAQRIEELKIRYLNKYNKFLNQTKNHIIKTIYGSKNVILNAINYSNKLLNRLANRFKIDLEDTGLRTGIEASKTLQQHNDNLKRASFDDACVEFNICRAGNEFTDNLSELITLLLEHNDDKVRRAVTATAKALKLADFKNIMDVKTENSFKKTLGYLEEMSPFELRVLLMAYKLIMDNRHQPILDENANDPLTEATVAILYVMNGFNKEIVLDAKEWDSIKKDFSQWLAKENVNIGDLARKLVDRCEEKILALDPKTANDFKAKLRLSMLAKSLRIHLNNYVQFQPFIM